TITASAADNVGVAGVQFRIDGANFGAEDTTAPYSISWNTTGAANGSHTLTAVARDAAGNRTTSAPVTVTVANAPPPDTTPPTVSISSPSNGQTISATVTVSANASDNVGVVGVQFGLDGANLGGEDTTAPYPLPWNTATASDGSHTLTAVARDAAGNSTPSAPVTVTVANNAPPPPPPPVTRFEDTDPSVVYSGPGWRSDMYKALSNGGATASDQAGAQATFTFTGTSVSWIGGRWLGELGPDNGGIARVFLDGAFMKEVDTYAPSPDPGHHSIFQAEHFKATGLADTSHTLTIEVTGRQNPAALRAAVIVDAFDV